MKGAIDSRIAEEQARQRSYQTPPARSNSGAKKPPSRAASPSVKSSRDKIQNERKEGDIPPKGPDPSDFESELVIDDESTLNGDEIPRLAKGEDQDDSYRDSTKEKPIAGEESLSLKQVADENGVLSTPELPTDVRVKLRKLERLEPRYNGVCDCSINI